MKNVQEHLEEVLVETKILVGDYDQEDDTWEQKEIKVLLPKEEELKELVIKKQITNKFRRFIKLLD